MNDLGATCYQQCLFDWEKLYEWSVIDIDTMTTDLGNKILLNIKEASDLFGIGQHRLREIVKEDYECRYHLTIGRAIKIKRKQFEEFINQVEQIQKIDNVLRMCYNTWQYAFKALL